MDRSVSHHTHRCVKLQSSILPSCTQLDTQQSPGQTYFILNDLVRRPEPSVDKFWEELWLVAPVKVALPSGRPEEGNLDDIHDDGDDDDVKVALVSQRPEEGHL